MTAILPALLVGGGLAAIVCALLVRSQEQAVRLADVLDLPFGTRGVENRQHPLVARVDPGHRLEQALARAQLGVRPEQFALLLVAVGLAVAAVCSLLLRTWVAVPVVLALAPLAGAALVTHRAQARAAALEAQLPDALSIVAGSLAAGHTFLRSLQLLCEEATPPLSDELMRVVRETQLGTPVVDALDAMAHRVGVADLRWIVQAIRVQQEVGGKLADLLHTLADFMRAREDVRREVRALTAEGRLSAWVLGALPPVLLVAVRVLNPGYLDPLLHGWGLAALGASAVSVAFGVFLIRRMVRIEV